MIRTLIREKAEIVVETKTTSLLLFECIFQISEKYIESPIA